jgi:glucuronosyltransferase
MLIFFLVTQTYKTFADTASNGFIVFSLGSAISMSAMPESLLQIFFKVFAKLPQSIICKWETDELHQDLPKNVMTTKWLPQQDLLGIYQ